MRGAKACPKGAKDTQSQLISQYMRKRSAEGPTTTNANNVSQLYGFVTDVGLNLVTHRHLHPHTHCDQIAPPHVDAPSTLSTGLASSACLDDRTHASQETLDN